MPTAGGEVQSLHVLDECYQILGNLFQCQAVPEASGSWEWQYFRTKGHEEIGKFVRMCLGTANVIPLCENSISIIREHRSLL